MAVKKERIIHHVTEQIIQNNYFPVIIEQTKQINLLFVLALFCVFGWDFDCSSFEIDTSRRVQKYMRKYGDCHRTKIDHSVKIENINIL